MTSSTSRQANDFGSVSKRSRFRAYGIRTKAVLLVTTGMLLVSCEATPTVGPSPTGTADAPAPTPTATSAVAPGKEPLTHDGRTVIPVRPDDCSKPAVEDIRSVLGEIAANLQPPEAKASARDGLNEVNCTFGLEPPAVGQDASPGNSLLIQTTLASNQAMVDSLALPRLMMAPETVESLGDKAWYSVNKLSDSTEYVLEIVEGTTVTRMILAVPAAAPEVERAREKLIAIAKLP